MSVRDTSIDPRLLESARDEFMKHGFIKADLKTICDNAGVTTGAVYKRYKGKEELFQAVVKDTVEILNSFVTVRTDIDFTADRMTLDFGIAVVLRIGAVFSMLFTILFGVIGILIRNKLYWAKLKRIDPEEYRFQVENPGLVTKLIRSFLEKKEEPETESAESPHAEADGFLSEPALQPQNDTNTITEQERKPTNGE